MSIIPIATAAQLVPAALVAGRVATDAIGSFAGLLRDAVDGSQNTPAKNSRPTPNAIPSGLNTLLRDFTSAFNRLLKNHNLDSSGSEVQLTLGKSGDVEVVGSHPQGSAIRNLLGKTPHLSELFRQIASQATAHRQEQEFAAFQANAHSPTQNFPLLFSSETAPKFQLSILGEHATPSFA